ncbi:hypothetical protein PC114_g22942 [Phytophthora cactorum]|uniref:Uncharacterized protein n=1 Tax=Phytophthora cactorum TaxID=29920 RepID=A0A8T1BB01_9STRA|nr:hypothetical protein PC114_g22942 [Phytophthora cactorum]KAG2897938.1 hypothetical protein PC117_g22690 [Phytophthora cactorum]
MEEQFWYEGMAVRTWGVPVAADEEPAEADWDLSPTTWGT